MRWKDGIGSYIGIVTATPVINISKIPILNEWPVIPSRHHGYFGKVEIQMTTVENPRSGLVYLHMREYRVASSYLIQLLRTGSGL
ncbi:hypothetical protein ABLT31_29270 [Ammoniphilus sp. 3BR4]